MQVSWVCGVCLYLLDLLDVWVILLLLGVVGLHPLLGLVQCQDLITHQLLMTTMQIHK